MDEPEPKAAQPCANCGRSTAVGTPAFAARRVIPPAAEDTAAESSYLCEECQEQIHVATRESRLTDEQLREKIASGEINGRPTRGLETSADSSSEAKAAFTAELRERRGPPEEAGAMRRQALQPYRHWRILRPLLGQQARPPFMIQRAYRFRIDDTLEEYVARARRHPIFELRPITSATGS